MNEITRFKLNRLRDPMLSVAIRDLQIAPRYAGIARSSGLGEAFLAKRADKAKARAKGRIARAGRRRNR